MPNSIQDFILQYPVLTEKEVVQGWNKLFKNSQQCTDWSGDGAAWDTITDVLSEEDGAREFFDSEVVQIVSEGGEGEGEYAYEVLHFKSKGIYLRIDGSYYSYDGFFWPDDYYTVEPQEKTIIIYAKKKRLL